ncbi:MAG: small multi-drug export protein [Ruminococcaceae bacterium]|nr:small multi-drug export protein [Oscillospiraceae bacterium]
MDSIAIWFGETLGQYIPAELVTFIVSLMPLLECRGGIIVGRLLGLPLATTLVFSVLGNILPIPFILLFIKKIFAWLKPTKLFGKIICKLEDRALKKSDALKKGEFVGLLLFVGIPLPGTGAWTGALISALFGVKIKKASLAILIGIALATTIMSLLMYGIL